MRSDMTLFWTNKKKKIMYMYTRIQLWLSSVLLLLKEMRKRTNVWRGFCRNHDIQMIIYTPTHAPVLSTFANVWSFLFPMLHFLHWGVWVEVTPKTTTKKDLLPCQTLCVAGLYLMYIESQTVTLAGPWGGGFMHRVPEMKQRLKLE